MARVTLNQAVNCSGEITTIAALLDSGRAFVERVEHWGKNDVVAYFATMTDDSGSWQIGQKAYESRAAKGQNVRPNTLSTTAQLIVSFDEESQSIIIADKVYPCKWDVDLQCFAVVLPGESTLITAIQTFAEVYEVHAHNPVIGFSAGVTLDFTPPTPTRTVTIPSRAQHEGIPLNQVSITLHWRCPECGHLRGTVQRVLSYDGSRRMFTDGWVNPCGHVDKYARVRAEAVEYPL